MEPKDHPIEQDKHLPNFLFRFSCSFSRVDFFQCTTHSCFEKHRLGFPFSWRWKGNQETQKLKQLETSRGCGSNIKWPTTSKHIVDLKISELTKSPPPKKKRCYQDCTTHGFAALPPNSFGKPKLSGLSRHQHCWWIMEFYRVKVQGMSHRVHQCMVYYLPTCTVDSYGKCR